MIKGLMRLEIGNVLHSRFVSFQLLLLSLGHRRLGARHDTTMYGVMAIDTTMYGVMAIDTTMHGVMAIDTTMYGVMAIETTMHGVMAMQRKCVLFKFAISPNNHFYSIPSQSLPARPYASS